jgi:phosphoribosylamine---glycine ligase
MRVLVIGSGGREHALCWALSSSPMLDRLWCAPGNPGIAEVADCVAIGALDIPALVAFAVEHRIDLVVPGPEAPLVAGITDAMQQAGIACFGPTAAAAELEGSKTFTKQIADAAGIPTALWERFDDAESAAEFVRRRGAPIVVKADGLAAGKGVVVAETEAEALAAIKEFMTDGALGVAGASVVIEECLFGEEASFFALCDGAHAIALGAAQDHKRVGDGDVGPNTGGMGAYSPTPAMSAALEAEVMARVIRPTLAEMAARGTPFRGFLFAGLMLTEQGVKLIEFNVRFGDPECQCMMLRLKSDLLAALVAAMDGELGSFDLRWSDKPVVAVTLAAEGYPANPRKHTPIMGVERAQAEPGVRVFHAGTDMLDGRLVANGGRVLTVCGTGDTILEARDAAYRGVGRIDWKEGFCRHDIAWRALAKNPAKAETTGN